MNLSKLKDSLRPLWRELEIAHLRWALREIPLTHPDLPRIVVRLHALKDERSGRLATWRPTR